MYEFPIVTLSKRFDPILLKMNRKVTLKICLILGFLIPCLLNAQESSNKGKDPKSIPADTSNTPSDHKNGKKVARAPHHGRSPQVSNSIGDKSKQKTSLPPSPSSSSKKEQSVQGGTPKEPNGVTTGSNGSGSGSGSAAVVGFGVVGAGVGAAAIAPLTNAIPESSSSSTPTGQLQPNLPNNPVNAFSSSSLAPVSPTNSVPPTPSGSLNENNGTNTSVVVNKGAVENAEQSPAPSKTTSLIESFFNIPWLGGKTSAPKPNNNPGEITTLASVVNAVVLSPSVAIPPVTYSNPSKFSTPLPISSSNAPYSVQTGERNTTGDNAVIDMAQAFKRGDRKRLSSTLVYAQGHPLEPWAAYWELRARLDEASYSEIRAFLKRYAGTYQEDRMRNDWLVMVGSRRDWETLLDEYSYFRMRDDKELQCYYLLAQYVQLGPKALPETTELVLQNWQALKDSDDGCMLAVDRLYDARKITETEIWRKIRAATEFNSARLAKKAMQIIQPNFLPELESILKSPTNYLAQQSSSPQKSKDELITLALMRLSAIDPTDAARQLQNKWQSILSNEQRTWVWAAAGREAALRNDLKALDYFERASADKDISNDELLAWKVRVALRMDTRPRWEMVDSAISAMSPNAQKDPAWVYWRARALLAKKPQTPPITQEAQSLLNSIASVRGFYEQLALEELGKKIFIPNKVDPPKPQELADAKTNPTIRRALYAINLGLRSEGNREWNYGTNLVDNSGRAGGMNDRELLAAATLACELEIWDRCVNAAERSKTIDPSLRFPMPFKELVLKRTKEIDLDPAYVYGLIRQESRFVMDAKSTVGASGLMQIMPKTAVWTAKKIGLINFRPETLSSREVNISIGTGYLKLVLDSFDGSMPMAAAAYNAGPSRVRHWQEGSIVEGAIWAEFLPFNETRDYVKKVLSNTINYQSIITSEPQSLKARLGMVGPMDASKASLVNPDLP